MEFLIVLVFLAAVFFLVNWLQREVKPEKHDEDNLGPMMEDGMPPFEGKVLTVPEGPESYEFLGALLAAYIRAIIALEANFGLAHGQGFKVENDDGAELQDFRYRALMISLLMLQGKLNTADLYGAPATCGQKYFYPEIYAFSCECVEKDLAQIPGLV